MTGPPSASATAPSPSVEFPYMLVPFHGEHRRAVSAVSFAHSCHSPARNSQMSHNSNSPQEHAALLASASADASVKVWNITESMLSEAQSTYDKAQQHLFSEQPAINPITIATAAASASSKPLSPLTTLCGHSRGINDVAWSRSTSNYLATASDDKSLRLWDAHTGDPLVEFRGHANFVFSVRFNPQSNLLVSGSFDETVKLWDVRSGECISTLPAHSDPVTGVDFNRDGTCIVSGSHDGLIRIWDTFTGECLKTMYAEGNPPVSFVQFSPNGRFVLAGTLDSKLRLWDVTTKYHPAKQNEGDGGEGSMVGEWMGGSGGIRKPTGLKCAKTYVGHVNSKFCTFAAFAVANPKRQRIVCGSEDGKVYLYGLQSRRIEQVLDGHTGLPSSSTSAGGDDGEPNSNEGSGSGPVLAVAAHTTREILASGGMTNDRTVRIWVPVAVSSSSEGKSEGGCAMEVEL